MHNTLGTRTDRLLGKELKERLIGILGFKDYVSLCRETYRLRQIPVMQQFLKGERQPKYDCWFQIHHYLARLGSWLRATNDVVKLSHQFPEFLVNCDVRLVPGCPLVDCEPLELDADVGVVLDQVCPKVAKGRVKIFICIELSGFP